MTPAYDLTPDQQRQVAAAASTVRRASANDPAPPVLPTIPDPAPEGKRLLRCPVPDCNHRFKSLARYHLHYRVRHNAAQLGLPDSTPTPTEGAP